MRLPTFYEQNLIPNWDNTSFMGTKKDKRYACLLYCISTTLSFKFLFMFSSPFQDSLKFFFTYEQ